MFALEVLCAELGVAAEVANQGVPGVMAMRYNVYADTAARFVEDVYQWLAAGRPLEAAVSDACKALVADPQRQIGATPVALQDWLVLGGTRSARCLARELRTRGRGG